MTNEVNQYEGQYEWDAEVAPHAPGLYDCAGEAEFISGLDAVDDAALTQYHERGFLAIHNAFTAQEVQDSIAGLLDLVAGKRPDFHVIQFRSEIRDRLHTMSLDEKLNNIRKLGTFTEYDARLKAIAEHPSLQNVLRRLLAAEPFLFQSMALIKPPRGREKPWHQDHAYFTLPREARVVGVWIALEAATLHNGCMRVLPGWHRRGAFKHFQLRDWQLADEQSGGFKSECLAVPLQPGGCLLFDSYLPHGTPSNDTPSHRKALQYHYVAAGTPSITHEERLAHWSGAHQ
jgi:ectoine hydroxylase-related dioxygenase (phytanoyl-CoA dioxygenase family)